MANHKISDQELAQINAVSNSRHDVFSFRLMLLQAAAVKEYGVRPRLGTSHSPLPRALSSSLQTIVQLQLLMGEIRCPLRPA